MKVPACRGFGVVLGWVLGLGSVMASDTINRPPEFEARSSPSARCVLELRLRADANPHAARSTATLLDMGAASPKLVWTRELPHRPRPRFAFVDDQCQVVLLDEWLNVRSALAVTVIDKNNRTVSVHDLEAVRAALDVPIGALAAQARHGVWIQAPPVPGAQGDAVEVAAGGRTLVIRMRDGALSSR